jgi:all-trans-retinol dehydrogenase (NAD+)
VKKLKDDIEKGFGFVDILINNAGIIPLTSLRECSDKDMQKIIDVNLSSHVWVR